MKRERTVSISLVALVLLLGLALVCPTAGTAQAEDNSASIKTKAVVQPVISLALQDSLEIDVEPRQDGTFSQNQAKLTVATNNSTGFKILLHAPNGTALVSSNLKDTDHKIESITEATTPSNFANNTWGVNIGDSAPASDATYQPISTTPTQITETDTSAEQNTYQVTFGAKVSTAIPAGTYFNQVVISAVANPMEVSDLGALQYMQDMQPEICQNSPEGTETTLIDLRDGTPYQVARMKDGNCWMTQNLALNLDSKTLPMNPNLSDIDFTWGYGDAWTDVNSWKALGADHTDANYPGAYVEPTTTNRYGITGNNTTTYSWNLGKVALATPTISRGCSDMPITSKIYNFCGAQGFVDVSGEEWKPTFVAQPGTYSYSSSTGPTAKPNSASTSIITVNTDTKEYDPHYLIGNYYQWNTATANTGGTIKNGVAMGSICPKGWKLPTSGSSFNTYSGSFQYLLNQYGLVPSISSGEYNVYTTPLNFLNSGLIDHERTALFPAGGYGYYWSASRSSSNSNYLFLRGDIVSTTSAYPGLFGASLRCIAR